MNLKLFIVSFGLALLYLFANLSSHVPIPADNLVGLFHPFSDTVEGVIYPKNSLASDPVRQQFPWKYEAIRQIKSGQLPLWNPYSLSGTPLLANIQTGALYPLNIIFFVPMLDQSGGELIEFARQWSIYIYLQSILGCIFFYLYARKIGLTFKASLLGSLTWVLSGPFLSWWQWGNLGHTILWFPLILWSIENIVDRTNHSLLKYHLVLLFALSSSFLAGHWQTFSFIAFNTFFYLIYRLPPVALSRTFPYLIPIRSRARRWFMLASIAVIFLLITSTQWLPSLEFIRQSARQTDLTSWQRVDWFYPYQHLVQFIAPDFFGNPSTQNYWGVWNYGEFNSYLGVIPLVFALSLIIRWLLHLYRRFYNPTAESISETNIATSFFLFCAVINLLLITKNPLSVLPFSLQVPFISSAQPSRAVVIVVFALSVIAAISFSHFEKAITHKAKSSITKNMAFWANLLMILLVGMLYCAMYLRLPLFGTINTASGFDYFQVAQRNLIPPAAIGSFLLAAIFLLQKSASKMLISLVFLSLIGVSLLDQARYFFKFNTFSSYTYLYPSNQLTDRLLQGTRTMTADDRIYTPNTNLPHRVSMVEGYDPLYLDTYGQFIGMWVRDMPDLSPFPTNRILTPHNFMSKLADIAAVDQVASIYWKADLCPTYTPDCQTIIDKVYLYQRDTALPKYTFIPQVLTATDPQQVARIIFSSDFDPHQSAIVLKSSPSQPIDTSISPGSMVQLAHQSAGNTSLIAMNNSSQDLFLYRAESFDAGWQVTINDQPSQLQRTNFAFQGVFIPPGTHAVKFTYLPPSVTTSAYLLAFGAILLVAFVIIERKGYNQVK